MRSKRSIDESLSSMLASWDETKKVRDYRGATSRRLAAAFRHVKRNGFQGTGFMIAMRRFHAFLHKHDSLNLGKIARLFESIPRLNDD